MSVKDEAEGAWLPSRLGAGEVCSMSRHVAVLHAHVTADGARRPDYGA